MRTFFVIALALLIAACATESQSKYGMGSDEYGPAPAADPTRTISDQDCTQRLALDGGNLRCR
jgi:uncharacterized lipoprotein YmbA